MFALIVLFYQVDGLNSLHSVKATPNRFTKTSQGRSWNTGNGSPDAICLTVDKPGIVLVGVCVYGGGGIHEYELEVLADDVCDSGLVLFFSHKPLNLSLYKWLHAVFSINPVCRSLAGANGAPRGLGTFSQVDVVGVGEGHLQHRRLTQ